MMKKQWVQFQLFRESFRQLQVPGWLFFAIFSLEAILLPLQGALTAQDHQSVTVVSGLQSHWILLATYILVAPTLTITMFSFLNRRSASDFYHALPYTRSCIFISFFTAIVVWMAFIVFGTGAVSMLMYTIFSRYFTLSYLGSFVFQLQCFVAGLLVAAVFALSMSITGTIFTNLVIAALILFFPRILITGIAQTVNNLLPMLSNDLPGLLNPAYNLVFSGIGIFSLLFGTSFFLGGEYDLEMQLWSVLYTFLLAVIYGVLGCWLFRIRKSEAAAASAPSNRIQSIFRITLTMAFCTAVCSILFSELYRGNSYKIEWFPFVILYTIALVIYCTYELITTRKWRKVFHALSQIWIVVVLNLALLGAMFGFCQAELAYKPVARRISSVSFGESTGISNYRITFSEYTNIVKKDLLIEDPAVLEIVSQQLSAYVEAYRNDHATFFRSFEDCSLYPFRIHTGAITRTRHIPLTKEQYDVVLTAMRNNAEVRSLWTTLPSAIRNTFSLNGLNTSQQNLQTLYDLLREEIKNIDFQKWFSFNHESH